MHEAHPFQAPPVRAMMSFAMPRQGTARSTGKFLSSGPPAGQTLFAHNRRPGFCWKYFSRYIDMAKTYI
jgi:hypothetical protein